MKKYFEISLSILINKIQSYSRDKNSPSTIFLCQIINREKKGILIKEWGKKGKFSRQLRRVYGTRTRNNLAGGREYRARRTANKVTLIAISEIEALCPALHVSTPGYCYLMAVRDRRDYISRGENERCRSQNTVTNHPPLLSVYVHKGGWWRPFARILASGHIYFRAFSSALFFRVIENARFDNVTVSTGYFPSLVSFLFSNGRDFSKMKMLQFAAFER